MCDMAQAAKMKMEFFIAHGKQLAGVWVLSVPADTTLAWGPEFWTYFK